MEGKAERKVKWNGRESQLEFALLKLCTSDKNYSTSKKKHDEHKLKIQTETTQKVGEN